LPGSDRIGVGGDPERARVAGKNIREIGASRKFPSECRFVAVYCQESGEVQISRAEHVINEGDELFIISRADDIKAASDFISDTPKSFF